MRLSTLPRFLIGSRSAIGQVADSRYGLACGFLFVLSAGFAREYDGEDLLREPWHALRPLAASLTLAAILFLLIDPVTRLRARETGAKLPPFAPAFRSFLAVYWMTAPLAWLYAIPYERWLSPVDAVSANLWTLAAVSVWRVLLMTRAISVLYGVNPIAVFFIVMLFGDALVFTLTQLLPTPLMDIMGGLRHTERDALIAGLTFSLLALSFISSPVWIIGAIAACVALKPRGRAIAQSEPSRALLVFAVASVLAWIPALIAAQPEQMRKYRAETLLRSGEIAQAFEEMSARTPDDYPPHWDPPPRLGYGERSPDLAEVRAAMEQQWPAKWVAEIYVDKINRRLIQSLDRHGDSDWLEVADRLTHGNERERVMNHADAIAFLLEHDDTLTAADREALEQLLELSSE